VRRELEPVGGEGVETAQTGAPVSISYFIMFAAVISFAALMCLKETAKAQLV
jgi:hypothetical protein